MPCVYVLYAPVRREQAGRQAGMRTTERVQYRTLHYAMGGCETVHAGRERSWTRVDVDADVGDQYVCEMWAGGMRVKRKEKNTHTLTSHLNFTLPYGLGGDSLLWLLLFISSRFVSSHRFTYIHIPLPTEGTRCLVCMFRLISCRFRFSFFAGWYGMA